VKATTYPGALPPRFFPGALYDGVTGQAMADKQCKSRSCRHPDSAVENRSGSSTKWCSLCGGIYYPGPGAKWQLPKQQPSNDLADPRILKGWSDDLGGAYHTD
jgi:hypothetical protein